MMQTFESRFRKINDMIVNSTEVRLRVNGVDVEGIMPKPAEGDTTVLLSKKIFPNGEDDPYNFIEEFIEIAIEDISMVAITQK